MIPLRGVKMASRYSGMDPKDEKIWHSYVLQARKATRIVAEKKGYKIKPKGDDSKLVCFRSAREELFYQSLASIAFSIFVAEYRINRVIEENKSKLISIYLSYYIYMENGLEKKKSCVIDKWKKYKKLCLYSRWRNILRAIGKKETKCYIGVVNKLNRWITLRNKIAHGDYKKIKKAKITPWKALLCYEAENNAIFELNVATMYGKRAKQMQIKREMSLRLL